MRIIYCGSGDFGAPTLRRLAADGHDFAAVITQPPRPAGRGGHLRPTPLSAAAGELGLSARAVEDINDAPVVAELAALAADVMVVADFGQMIRPPARQAARLGAINLHGSLLPELRGAAPVNWAIIRGYTTTGVTVFELVERMDAGPMYARRSAEVRPDETAQELRRRLSQIGVEAVVETLLLFASGKPEGEAQDESRATRAPLLKKTDGVIDWSAGAPTIRNLVHGTWPWPGGHARCLAGGKEIDVIIARARAAPHRVAGDFDVSAQSNVSPALPRVAGVSPAPGTVTEDLSVACGDGRLEIVEIKPAGGRLMPWRDFVKGHRVTAGSRFVPVQT